MMLKAIGRYTSQLTKSERRRGRLLCCRMCSGTTTKDSDLKRQKSYPESTRPESMDRNPEPTVPVFPVMFGTNMKAILKSERARGLTMQDVPIPAIGPNDVLIKIKNTAMYVVSLRTPNFSTYTHTHTHKQLRN